MNLIRSAKATLTRLTEMSWGFFRGGGGGGSSLSYLLQPGTGINYALEVGDPWRNAVAYIALSFLARNLVKPELCVYRDSGKDDAEEVDDHPLVTLLDRPNPYHSYADLIKFTALQYSTGNAYWLKIRGRGKQVVQLYPVPNTLIEPWSTSGTELVEYYRYRPGGECYELPPSEVVHFKNGIDPDNPALGLSDLGYLLRELATDNALNTMVAAVSRNLGIVGLLVSPKPGEMISTDDVTAIRDSLVNRTTADNSGKPLVLRGAVDVSRLGWSVEEMELSKLRDAPGERIAAALGFSAMALNLPSASKTYSNYAESLKSAWHQGVIPVAEAFAEALYHQLLPDLGDPATERIVYEFDQVEALQEDQNSKWDRVGKAYQTYQVITRAEARKAMGFDAEPERDDVFFAEASGSSSAIDDGTAMDPELETENELETEDDATETEVDDQAEDLGESETDQVAAEVRRLDPFFSRPRPRTSRTSSPTSSASRRASRSSEPSRPGLKSSSPRSSDPSRATSPRSRRTS